MIIPQNADFNFKEIEAVVPQIIEELDMDLTIDNFIGCWWCEQDIKKYVVEEYVDAAYGQDTLKDIADFLDADEFWEMRGMHKYAIECVEINENRVYFLVDIDC